MSASATTRRALLALLVLGLSGIAIELVLLAHYDDTLQFVPFAMIAASLGSIGWHVLDRGSIPLGALRVIMALLVVTGLVGIVLHYRGSLEFQVDIDPAQSGWELFKKVVRAKAPPVLAPGAMAQLGLLGLVYTHIEGEKQ